MLWTRSSPFFAVGRRGDALARAGFFVTSLSTLFRSATINWQWFGRILLKQRSTPCAYINTVFYISLFYVCPIYTTGVMWPDAVYFMHCCVDHFLRIKLFQVHITDMKMNLSCCFEGHRFVCFIVYNTSKKHRYSFQHLWHGEHCVWLRPRPVMPIKKRKWWCLKLS